jgi:FkbM family methyltransferase
MLKKILRLSEEIIAHPFKQNKIIALIKFFIWHSLNKIGVHFFVTIKYINDSKLIVDHTMNQAQKNIYLGLTEFNEIAFIMHYLRKGDSFVDVGANVGEFAIASLASGANCIAFEAMPDTFQHLKNNILYNGFDRYEIHNIGIGEKKGYSTFKCNLPDTQRRRISEKEKGTLTDNNQIEIPMSTLDEIIGEKSITVLKIDVEGYEESVMEGSKRIFSQSPPHAVILEIWNDAPGCRLRTLMESYGYEGYSYTPYNRSLVREKKNQNIIFIKNYTEVLKRVSESDKFTVRGIRV